MLRQERPPPPDGGGSVPADDQVVVGRLAGAYGIKGWIRVVSFTDPVDNLKIYRPWSVRRRDGWRRVDVQEIRPHGRGFVVKLAGVETRDESERMAGADVGVPRSSLPPAGPDAYYWSDLIGLDVFDRTGRRLGQVVRLMETGAHDVLVVADTAASADTQVSADIEASDDTAASVQARAPEDAEILIPFVGAVVGDVDLDAGRLVVDWAVDAGVTDRPAAKGDPTVEPRSRGE
jgi:16S rRNA processing protein RimM